jgi:hypothetical protein
MQFHSANNGLTTQAPSNRYVEYHASVHVEALRRSKYKHDTTTRTTYHVVRVVVLQKAALLVMRVGEPRMCMQVTVACLRTLAQFHEGWADPL